MNAQLSKNQKIFLVTIVLVVAGLMFFHSLRFSGVELFNLIGVGIGVLGSLLAIWQVILAKNANAENKENNLQLTLDSIRSASDERDRTHEQILADMKAQIAGISAQLNQHQESLGHDGSLQHILAIKDQISKLEAMVAVMARQAEFGDKLDNLERMQRLYTSRVEQIEKLIDSVKH